MKNIKLTIEYEGTNYWGWQIQNNLSTVQGELKKAISIATGEEIHLIGSGRTDKKVHSLGQVANFITNSNIPGEKYKYLLDFLLPEDISIVDSEEVDINFHSRFDAIRKKYKYIVYNQKLPSAIYRNFSYHVKDDLNIDDMVQASKYFIGTHDFTSFKVSKTIKPNNIRTIYHINIEKKGDIIEFTFEGNSFLHNMVRIIVGTLIYVGKGRIKKSQIPGIILDKNRDKAGITAPPQGLFLEKVFY
jgi:tRNA pseudouridine38-40 synthase